MTQPVRWGVLLPMQRSEGVELYGVASRDPEKAKNTAKQFGIPTTYDSYEALLADPSIEAVYLPLPNNMHAEWIRKAADAGKRILCEKPLALNAGEARESFAYAAKKGILLMEAFMYRFHPQWIHARELIRTGHIGNLKAIHTFFGYNNPDPENIRNRPETGGGAIYDIGCYATSLSRLLFEREPERVLSCISRDESKGVDVLTSAIMDFGGPRSLFTVGMRVFPWQRVEIFGSGGRIEIKIPFNSYNDIPSVITVATGIGEREIPAGPSDQFRLEFEAFSAAVRSGGPAPIPGEDTVANLAVMDALFRSETSGRWEKV